jgi:hypothetical protein
MILITPENYSNYFVNEYSQKSNTKSADVEYKNANLAPMVREIGKKSLPPLVAEINW